MDQDCTCEIHKAGEDQEWQEPPVPPSVEHVAGDNNQCISGAKIAAYQIVRQRDGTEEQQELV